MSTKKLFVFLGISFFSFFLLAVASGAAEDDVACTVTVQNIACSVADGDVTYGILGTNDSAHTAAGGNGETQTITNDGNDDSDIDLKGISTTSNGGSWTLVSTRDEAEEYEHEYCITDCDSSPVWVNLTLDYAEIKSGLAPLGTQDFDLQITTPTSTADYDQQSPNVWAQCSPDT